ncbi:MAG: AAA family ATPase [Byssovorax sp.]
MLVDIPNPFEGSVVLDAWSPAIADVASIHRDAFNHCLDALKSVSRGRPDSILVYGPAGSGKTHLLTRLQRHLLETAETAPDRTLHCVFVAVKLQTHAALLWQHVRRRLASDLLRKQQGVTQLQRLIAHQLAAAKGNTPRHWVRALRVLSGADGDAVSEYFAEVAERIELGRDLCVVLEHLVNNRFVMDARAWLAGDSLPESALGKLGLGPDEQEDREEAARLLVTALCRLAGETLPIVFCFDQIEALQTTPDDRDALFRFGRMAADLSEADHNVLLISCIQSAFLDLLGASVRDADRDRIFKRRAVLSTLTREQVGALIEARLDGIAELRELRASAKGRFHPFDDATVDALAETMPCVPRKVITAAAVAFERLRRGEAPSAPPIEPQPSAPAVERFLEGSFAKRRAAALSAVSPEQSRDTLLHGLPLLRGLLGAPPSAQRVPGLDLVLPFGEARLGVAVCNETNMKSLAARLRTLCHGGEALSGLGLRVLRDPRLPITKSAKKCLEYMGEIEAKGGRLVQPSVEAMAALEALRSLLSDARAGDLSARGDAVDEKTVADWLRRCLDDALTDLCDAIEARGDPSASPSGEERSRALDALLLGRFVIRLDAAAQEIGCGEAEALSLARRHPDRFGVLSGPPVVLFVHVPAESIEPVGE